MSSGIPGHSPPTAGFEVPLEMLSACHFRIEQQCATLRRLVTHLANHGADEEARTAAANVMRYFDTSAKHHHADEEKDLFPALIESMAGSDPVCLREMTQGLAAEHRELDALERIGRAMRERRGIDLPQ
ncbi:hemerythrin domain-containing protein [Variovorax sp. J22G21]|uniref:hemerythrin domain-containing protein n=1 Tax=Variovorax fucosicus TaxID=3053517 RepID=UPI0025769A46|nr:MULTISPECIES: hemerythrin domain-containing protein [unclassified Variovorax]MDM0037643.1 hemerythrin domain-containing protein [Variovorax sp. J22R193]MDM0056689.1 hemerythrin domain-containing protein [Variovorax sp. J22G47]MDM0062419.1 hemerythrin domain-containing protein [Variovorax sp. J22G21]